MGDIKKKNSYNAVGFAPRSKKYETKISWISHKKEDSKVSIRVRSASENVKFGSYRLAEHMQDSKKPQQISIIEIL